MYTLHSHCRACGYGRKDGPGGIKSAASADKLIPVFSLGVQPLANDFVKDGEEHAGFAPLEVLFCPRCSLAQLSVVVDWDILYRNYAYVTSDSAMMRAHFAELLKMIEAEVGTIQSMVEIGSNDGALLEWFKKERASIEKVVGIDPAVNLAAIASKRGIYTIMSLFDQQAAVEASRMLARKVDVVVARHCFCHTDDWEEFIHALDVLCNADTLVCIEAPYAKEMLEKREFDTVYHEHLSYLTLQSVRALLEGTRFRIHKIVKHSIHGGALTIMLRTNDSTIPPDQASLEEFLYSENITQEMWKEFNTDVWNNIQYILEFVEQRVSDGKTVGIYGASAKSTVLVNACGFSRKHIKFITDTTPQKQYRTCPGTDIPIVDPGAVLRELPDYMILGAWNFASEILEKESLAREKGVKFVVPVPELRVL